MNDTTLNKIESIFDFNYPTLYHQLCNDGMLDVGEYSEKWYKTVFPQLKDNPTLLLFCFDFEVLTPSAVYEALEEITQPDSYLAIKHDYDFIPFAQSGAGDYYCFFLNGADGDNIPIVMLFHDENKAEFLAKNIQDFIFIMLLTYMAEKDDFNQVSDTDFLENINNLLKTHINYLTPAQQMCLTTLTNRQIIDYTITFANGRSESYRGLLNNSELVDMTCQFAPYDKAAQAFAYSDE